MACPDTVPLFIVVSSIVFAFNAVTPKLESFGQHVQAVGNLCLAGAGAMIFFSFF